MASIQERRNAAGNIVYRVLSRIDKKQTSATFDTRELARRHQKRIDEIGPAAAQAWVKAQVDESASDAATLKDWTATHLDSATGLTSGTRAEYARLAKRTFLPHLGHRRMDELSRDDVRRWVNVQSVSRIRSGAVMSSKSLANAHGFLSTLFKAAVEAGVRADNPAKGIKLPRGVHDEMVTLTENEFSVLLNECIEPYYRPFVLALAATGMRFGELTALQCGDVDLDADQPSLRVVRAWKKGPGAAPVLGPPKTARGRRVISLAPEAVHAMRPLMREAGDLVFTAKRGGRIANHTFHQSVWQPAIHKFAGDVTAPGIKGPDGRRRLKPTIVTAGNGKRPRVHDLRHTHASWMLADPRINLMVLARRLGHEKVSTTVDLYGHLSEGAPAITAAASSRAISIAYPMIEDASQIEA